MCMQDYQLARAVKYTPYTVTTAAPGIVQALPINESRVGLFFTGPTAGTITVYLGGNTDDHIATAFTVTGGHNVRSLTLLDDGYVVTEPVWIGTSVAATMVIYEYELPYDPAHLARLAALGRW